MRMFNIGLLILRVTLGLVMAGHGAQKLFGWWGGEGIAGFGGWLESMGMRPARAWAVLAALIEFVGGLAVAVGLVTPIAALLLAGTLLVAILLAHLPNGFWNASGGYEYPLVLVASLVAISLTGPGFYSIDDVFGITFPEPVTWLIVAVIAAVGGAAAFARSQMRPAGRPRPQVG
jgi:putative oxidoreductase